MTDSVLEFRQLAKSFGSTAVLKSITARVQTGEVIGLLGLNGAGKTTLLETLLGFVPPTKGQAQLFGHDSMTGLDQATKHRIGFVPQRDELLDGITGHRYLALVAGFYTRWNSALIARLAQEWAVPLDVRISTLSVGQRQKLSIISALGHEPELIVLDEPVASLDPVARRMFLKELVDIADTHQRTILFSTHIVSDLERVASRVWLLQDGLIAVDEDLDTLKEHCARVHLPPGMTLPSGFTDTHLIQQRVEQNTRVLVFKQWTAATHQELEQVCGVSLAPEWLSLEDIFLELHATAARAGTERAA